MCILKKVKKKLNLYLPSNMTLENLKFPIGHFEMPVEVTSDILNNWIAEIQQLPNELIHVVQNLSKKELKLIYRPNGWNIKQVIHHLSDSHSNALIRFKLALTEENPTIKPYEENLWAELVDGMDDDISYSLLILKGLHHKWHLLLVSMDDNLWERTYFHPESKKSVALKEMIGLYAWHGNHHLAHIKQALQYKGEFEL